MKWWLLIIVVLGIGCSLKPEGVDPKDCSDERDNDNDGLYDCQDDGCMGQDYCVEKKLENALALSKKKTDIPPKIPTVAPDPQKKDELGPYFAIGHLVVQRSQNGENINWLDAAHYCESLKLGGIFGWRLPTQSEAVKIVESGILSNEPSYVMWTSTKKGTKRAVIVGITGGAVNHLAVQSKGECRARCVRDAI